MMPAYRPDDLLPAYLPTCPMMPAHLPAYLLEDTCLPA